MGDDCGIPANWHFNVSTKSYFPFVLLRISNNGALAISIDDFVNIFVLNTA